LLNLFYQAPIRHISDAVYKTSVDWINLRSPEALSFFLLWSLDSILDELRSQLTKAKHEQLYEPDKYEANKDAKKAVQLTSESSVTYISLCHEIVVVFFYFKFYFS
jgi:hypothetical protein